MAKEEVAESTEEKPKKKSLVKIIVITLISLIVLGGAGVGGLLYMKKQKQAHEKAAEEEEDHAPTKLEYVVFEKFVTNLRSIAEDGSSVDKFIALELSFEIKDDDKKEAKKAFIKTYTPMIKNTLLMTIDKFDDKQLLQAEGKQRLADMIRDDLNKIYKESEKMQGHKKSPNIVENILFTSFIIQ